MTWRWYGLAMGTVVGFFLTLGLPDPPPHRHAHAFALALGIDLFCIALFWLLGVIADER
jgi:hypothetical protein